MVALFICFGISNNVTSNLFSHPNQSFTQLKELITNFSLTFLKGDWYVHC